MARKDFHIYTNDPDVISKIDFCKFEIFHFSIFDFFNSHFLENPERS